MAIIPQGFQFESVAVCYYSKSRVGGRPPVVANLLQRGAADGFIPTMPGTSKTKVSSYVCSGLFTTPFSESLEVHHNHSTAQECVELATTALKSGDVWSVSDLLSRLTSCRDAMAIFRDSARLTYPLKLVTPSSSGGLPIITDKGTLDLGSVLESEISLDRDTISRIENLFRSWVLGLDPPTPVVMQPSRRCLTVDVPEFPQPSPLELAVQMPVAAAAPFSSGMAAEQLPVLHTVSTKGGIRRSSFTSLRYLPDCIVAKCCPSLRHLPDFMRDEYPQPVRRNSI